jgi:hypothetical protein
MIELFYSSGKVEQFDDHELVYTLRIPGASNVSLRVRYALDDLPNPIYHLRYVASAELDKSQNVSVRQFHDCCVTKNIQLFLTEIGFIYDHEFFAKGDIFRKGRMKITGAKISHVNIIDYYLNQIGIQKTDGKFSIPERGY